MHQAWLLPALPAAAFAFLAFANFSALPAAQGRLHRVIATTSAFVLFILVAADLFKQLPAGPDQLVNNTSGFDWMKFSGVPYELQRHLRIGFKVDQLTVVMLCVVSFVGMLVQIYSLGYMKGEVRCVTAGTTPCSRCSSPRC